MLKLAGFEVFFRGWFWVTADKIPRINVRLRNISDEEQAVVRSVDASDVGWRYPKYACEILDAVGKPETDGQRRYRCGNCNVLKSNDVKILKPGEEFDPFGPGSFDQSTLRSWKPHRAGVYTVRIVCDFSSSDPAEWNGRIERAEVDPESVWELIRRVPKVKLEAKLEIDVKP